MISRNKFLDCLLIDRPFFFKFKMSHSVFFYSGASHVSALISPITRVFLSLFLQMHDFSTFPARLIQTNGKQPPDFGNCGILPLHCTPMGQAKSLTMATSSAREVMGALRPLPWRRRWHLPWAYSFAPTANFLWNSLLRLESTSKAAMVGWNLRTLGQNNYKSSISELKIMSIQQRFKMSKIFMAFFVDYSLKHYFSTWTIFLVV